MNNKTLQLLSALIALFMFAACNKDNPGPQDDNDGGNYEKGLLILNEGNFGSGNGSLSFWDMDADSTYHGIFQSANSLPAGDVIQSYSEINGEGWLVVNNSGKIEVVNPEDFTSIATIDGLSSPRYVLDLGNGKVWVTDLFSGNIQIINAASKALEGTISTGGWSEKMLMKDNNVFVTIAGRKSIWVMNPETGNMVDSINVGQEPNGIVEDKNGMIWVLCSGGYLIEKPTLHKIDPASNTVVWTDSFPDINDYPSELSIDDAGENLYYLSGNLYKMNVAGTELPSAPVAGVSSKFFYKISVAGEDIYASDPVDYVNNGKVYSISQATGMIMDSTSTGIIPGFMFLRQ